MKHWFLGMLIGFVLGAIAFGLSFHEQHAALADRLDAFEREVRTAAARANLVLAERFARIEAECGGIDGGYGQ